MKEDIEVDIEPKNVEKSDGAGLPPVAPNETGLGYPYAPQNWPKPGDNWRWKVGSRITKRDYHVDRYLYAPKHLPQPRAFASKSSVERYIRKEFPDADVDAFFDMFAWNIPAKRPISSTDDPMSSSSESSSDMNDDFGLESQLKICPAGKKSCKGLLLEAEKPTMHCDICCTGPDFCRHCSCILCSKTVKYAFGGYSYFRCETVVNEAYICGHVAHLDCALRCYMAGTVGGVFKLDAAYYCRRCDARSDLVPHVTKFFEIGKSIDSRSHIEMMLKLGICILRGSKREPAQALLHCIESAFYKFHNGSPLKSIWEAEDFAPAMPLSGFSNASERKAQPTNMDASVLGTAGQNNGVAHSPGEEEINPLKLEDEIYDTLRSLKKIQEAEYQLAEGKLHAQKTYLINLQEQLEYEKSQLASRSSSAETNMMLGIVRSRTEQIKRELKKFREMEEAYKTFRKVP